MVDYTKNPPQEQPLAHKVGRGLRKAKDKTKKAASATASVVGDVVANIDLGDFIDIFTDW